MKEITKVRIKPKQNTYDDFDGFEQDRFDGFEQDRLYAFCSKDFKQATFFQECRECFIEELSHRLLESVYASEGIDPLKTRILVAKYTANDSSNRKIYEKETLSGLRLIHHFEKEAGWNPSRIYRTEGYKNNISVYFLKGDGRWQRTSYTLSLYLLLIRLGRHPEFNNCKTVAGIKKAWNKVSNINTNKVSSWGVNLPAHDAKYMNADMYKKSITLMRNFKSVFGTISSKEYFARLFSDDEYLGNGIYDFCNGNVNDKRLLKRFDKICSKHKI